MNELVSRYWWLMVFTIPALAYLIHRVARGRPGKTAARHPQRVAFVAFALILSQSVCALLRHAHGGRTSSAILIEGFFAVVSLLAMNFMYFDLCCGGADQTRRND
jgi:hypothetical protein